MKLNKKNLRRIAQAAEKKVRKLHKKGIESSLYDTLAETCYDLLDPDHMVEVPGSLSSPCPCGYGGSDGTDSPWNWVHGTGYVCGKCSRPAGTIQPRKNGVGEEVGSCPAELPNETPGRGRECGKPLRKVPNGNVVCDDGHGF